MSEPVPELTHQEIEELLGAYALDALDPDEAAIVERHLNECIRCAIEVSQHHEVVGLLANSGSDAPGELWDKIADRLETPGTPRWDRLAARLDRPPVTDIPSADGEPTPPGEAAQPGSNVIPIGGGQHRGRTAIRAMSVVAAAAAVLAVVLGVQVHHLDNQVSAMSAQAGRPALTTAVQTALEDPSTQRVRLTPPAAAPTNGSSGTSVTIVIGKSGTGYLIAQGLAPLPSSQTYQLWGSIEGKLISLGVLGSKPTITAFSFDSDVHVQAFAITAEPGGGVVSTTNQPVVEGAVET